MSSLDIWRELEDTVIDERVWLQRLLSADRGPVFQAALVGSEEEETVRVRFWPESSLSGPVLDRHREASFLSHPHLLRCFGGGLVQVSGSPFVYGVYEAYDVLLADLLAEGPLPAGEVRALSANVIEGLLYLHQRGLVYGNLDRTTVARTAGEWKLSDYSQLRSEGSGYASETRRLLATLPGTPPEAFQGWVTPAWDAWSLAHLIKAAVLGPRPPQQKSADDSVRPMHRHVELAEPFATITGKCLVADPGERCSLAEIAECLDRGLAGQPAAPSPEPEPAEPEVEAVPPLQQDPPPTQIEPIQDLAVQNMGPYQNTRPYQNSRKDTARRWLLAAGIGSVALVIAGTYARSPRADRASASPEVRSSPAGALTPQPTGNRSRTAEPSNTVSTDSLVFQLLESWAEGFRAGDLNAQMTAYAPILSRFYLASNVPSDVVRRVKEETLKNAGEIRKYEISNVRTRYPAPQMAVVTFDKTWVFAGNLTHTGKVRGELKLEKADGRWRIISERDIKVYRQNKTRHRS